MGGTTSGATLPSSKPALTGMAAGKIEGFILKYSPAGALLYATLIGGGDHDLINDITVDSHGSVYFCGSTASTNFPLVGAIQPNNRGGGSSMDAMFGKLNPAGTALVYSTYYGGNYTDRANACVVDADGNLYVTGYTVSDAFPFTPGAFQTSNRSPIAGNGFVTKIAPLGDKAVFSTYLGGGIDDELFDIAIDRNRNIYVAGQSFSPNYPLAGAFQATNRGAFDAVVSKLNAAGSGLLFSTFLGAAQSEFAYSVDVDANDNVFITGKTSSTAFPTTANALKRELEGPTDLFIAKFDANATTRLACTLFGGNRDEDPYRTVLDANGSLYITGSTTSGGIRAVDAVQGTIGGAKDAFLLKVSPSPGCGPDVYVFRRTGGRDWFRSGARPDGTDHPERGVGVIQFADHYQCGAEGVRRCCRWFSGDPR